jgi:Ca-activated chloride channel family protein
MRRSARGDRVAILFALCGMVVALAGPRSGFDEVEVQSSGADIFVALDLSNSMLADDIRPSRFERARREVFDLIAHINESGRADRVGLVGFAGVSFVQCPLTADMNALREYLMLMNPGEMPVQGTDLGGAIRTALAALQSGGAGPAVASNQAIILISDGEDLESEAESAMEEAEKRGVRIFTLGVGTSEGAAVPDLRAGGLMKDRGGKVVISRFNGKALREIAERTGGRYVELSAPQGMVKQLDFLEVLGESIHDSGKVRFWHERFQIPLGLAVLAVSWLGWSGLRAISAWLVGLFMVGLMLNGTPAIASDDRETKKAYNEGIEAYERGDFTRARELFEHAGKTGNGEVSARSLYNMGNAAVGVNDLDSAEKAYEEVLKLAPGDREAAENLAWVREQKKNQQPQTQQQVQQKSDQQQKEERKKDSNQQHQSSQGKSQSQDKQQSPQDQFTQGQSGQNPAEKPGVDQNPSREWTPEEAKRMLNSVDDLKSKYLYFMLPKDQQQKAAEPPEKDW